MFNSLINAIAHYGNIFSIILHPVHQAGTVSFEYSFRNIKGARNSQTFLKGIKHRPFSRHLFIFKSPTPFKNETIRVTYYHTIVNFIVRNSSVKVYHCKITNWLLLVFTSRGNRQHRLVDQVVDLIVLAEGFSSIPDDSHFILFALKNIVIAIVPTIP